jgi:UDP-N-acetylglucosamine 4-epimerase
MRWTQLKTLLPQQPRRWLVTGAAGFIGSNLVETLLGLGQSVVGFDDFSTGKRKNLEQLRQVVGAEAWKRFLFLEGSITSLGDCHRACGGVDYVLHQAALGSVPRSIENPLATHEANVSGFMNMLLAARDAKVQGFVYASSSAVYGDHPALPKVEGNIGESLSPYAASKYMDELYAQVFARCYGFRSTGLRYFNVFGPRQDPEGAYAAVIPKWIAALLQGEPVHINGDGETSRDFCFVVNVVQANLLAATATDPQAWNRAYNVALGGRTTLNQLFDQLRTLLSVERPELASVKPCYRDFRAGDVRHSQADISAAQTLLGYAATHTLEQGLRVALPWYLQDWAASRRA